MNNIFRSIGIKNKDIEFTNKMENTREGNENKLKYIEDEYDISFVMTNKKGDILYRTEKRNTYNECYNILSLNLEKKNLVCNTNLLAYNFIKKNYYNDIKNFRLTNDRTEKGINIQYDYGLTKNEFMKQYDEIINEFKILVQPSVSFLIRGILSSLGKLYFEKIADYEKEFFNTRNSFIYLNKNHKYIKEGYEYDINSFFPYCYSHKKFKIPMTKGKPMILKNIEDLKKYKNYNVKLDVNYINFEYMHNLDKNKVYYSNYDVEMFDMTKGKVEYKLIDNGKINFMYWDEEDMINGSTLFDKIITPLYDMKKNGNKIASSCLRMIHGKLFFRKKKLISKKDFLNIENKEEIQKIKDNLCGLKIDKTDKIERFEYYCPIYKTNPLIRMKFFLYSFTRYLFYKKYIHEKDYVIHRIYIDSIIINKELDEKLVSDKKIGKMKFVKKIKNLEWEVVNKKPEGYEDNDDNTPDCLSEIDDDDIYDKIDLE